MTCGHPAMNSNPIGSTINPVDSIALPGCPYPKLALYHPGFGPILDLSRYNDGRYNLFRPFAVSLSHSLLVSPFRPLSPVLCATLLCNALTLLTDTGLSTIG
jgi:hypothetical protein